MNETLQSYIKDIQFTSNLKLDVSNLLAHYNHDTVYHHCSNVAVEAVCLAGMFGEDGDKARTLQFTGIE